MAKRHADALLISDGACNPSGIAHAIVAGCKEMIEAGTYGEAKSDPALRLMVYQLGFLLGFNEVSMQAGNSDWFDWRDACRAAGEG